MFGVYLVSNILVVWDIPLRLLSCTYFSSFFAASAWAEESSKSNTIPDLANSACETHISIHAPMKGATVRLKRWHRHFNPRSRKGSDHWHNVINVLYGISILAPAKEATKPV